MAVYQSLVALVNAQLQDELFGLCLALTMMMGIAGKNSCSETGFFFCNVVVAIMFFNKVDYKLK